MVLSCGGLVQRLDYFYCYTFTCFDEDREREWRDVMETTKASGYEIYPFLANTLRDRRLEIRKVLEEIKEQVVPDVVFVHSSQSSHPDHVVLNEEAHQIFRYTSVIGYGGCKDGNKFTPNMFIELTRGEIDQKIEYIKGFKIEGSYQGFMSPESVEAVARFRGVQIGTEFAEAFRIERLKI